MHPSRGHILVKPIETQELVGGIVLLEETRQRWVGQQCEVLAVGEPETCDFWKDCERQHDVTMHHLVSVSAGDWILVRPRSYVATDVDKQWIVKQSDVLARLHL